MSLGSKGRPEVADHPKVPLSLNKYKLYTPEKTFVDTYITFLVLKVSLNSTINVINTRILSVVYIWPVLIIEKLISLSS